MTCLGFVAPGLGACNRVGVNEVDASGSKVSIKTRFSELKHTSAHAGRLYFAGRLLIPLP